MIAWKGLPAEIETEGDMESEQVYGNHRSAAKYGGAILRNVATDVALGIAIVFPEAQAKEIDELPFSSVEVVEEEEKLRVIHNLTFIGGATVQNGEGPKFFTLWPRDVFLRSPCV